MNMKNLQSVQPISRYSELLQQVGLHFVPDQRSHIFCVHVIVHRNKFLYYKTNQMHQFP